MAFDLELDQLTDIRRAFVARVREGLQADEREIKAIPAWVSAPPRGGPRGEALAVDFGGTNLRSALVRFGDGDAEVRATEAVELPLRQPGTSMTRDDLFEAHARSAQQLEPEPGLPVGYCFSYPFAARRDGDARLIRWTKDVDIPGVEGELVGSALREHLSRVGLEPGPVRVLNDTVASLLAATVDATESPDRAIGLIAGTGTNMAAFFGPNNAPKLEASMAVNLESGNFSPPHLTEFDQALDADSPDRGQQLFEKAISGRYLGLLFAAASPDAPADFDAQRGAAAVAQLAASDGPHATLARSVLTRSADLVAAGLAGLMDVLGDGPTITIQAEGGLFWSPGTGYADRVRATLTRLTGASSWQIQRREHANFVGSACAALGS